MDGGTLVKTFDLPVTFGYDDRFHWSPDSHAFVYINTLSGVSNLWRQPLDGSPAKQITDFKAERIWNFAYSRDGRSLAFARGTISYDVVLIREEK